MERASESGLLIDAVYDESKLTDFRLEDQLGHPGQYSFTRGTYRRCACGTSIKANMSWRK
jgi:hypothetical protein